MSAATYTVAAGRFSDFYVTESDPIGHDYKYIDDFATFDEAYDRLANLSGPGYDFVHLEVRVGDFVTTLSLSDFVHRPLFKMVA